MGKQRNRQNNQRHVIKNGQVVGDKHSEREGRGNEMLRSERSVNREDYELGWFHPTISQKEIIKSMIENDLTLVDSPSGCGKSTTVIHQALKWLKSGDYRKIVFIKTPTQLGCDDVGFLGTNEAKFDYPLQAMRGIFEDFMSKEKLQMEEKNNRIEFMFPNWLGGSTFGSQKDGSTILVVDELQWFTPEMVKLVLERPTDNCKVICMFDSQQRYASKQRPDGAKDLVERVTEVVDGVRFSKEPLVGYVKLTTNENRRGRLSKRITELYANLDFDK